MSATLDKIIAEVKALPPDERRELRDQLDSLFIELRQSAMTEDEFARRLAAQGIISLPDPSTGEDAAEDFRSYQPITVAGPPLSEMITEERR